MLWSSLSYRSETLWCVGNTVQKLALYFFEQFYSSSYGNTIRIARPRACETIACGKAERNINSPALANHFGRKRKHYRPQVKILVCQADFVRKNIFFFAFGVCLPFGGRLKSRKSKQHTRVVVAQRIKNSLAPAGKAINAYGWNFSLLSSSYQLQCRYASRMCLVENAQHERIFAYIQSGFARTKPRVNCFVHHYCFVFEN